MEYSAYGRKTSTIKRICHAAPETWACISLVHINQHFGMDLAYQSLHNLLSQYNSSRHCIVHCIKLSSLWQLIFFLVDKNTIYKTADFSHKEKNNSTSYMFPFKHIQTQNAVF